MSKNTCRDCKFVRVDSGTYTCHYSPPIPFPFHGQIHGTWPMIKSDDWCGRFRVMEDKMEDKMTNDGVFNLMFHEDPEVASAAKVLFMAIEKAAGGSSACHRLGTDPMSIVGKQANP